MCAYLMQAPHVYVTQVCGTCLHVRPAPHLLPRAVGADASATAAAAAACARTAERRQPAPRASLPGSRYM